jgi:uncharacterized lipoprotein YajG
VPLRRTAVGLVLVDLLSGCDQQASTQAVSDRARMPQDGPVLPDVLVGSG